MSNFFTSRRNFLFLKISLETKKKLKFWNFFRSTYHEMRLQCTYFQFQWKKNQNFGLFYFKWIFREFLYFHPMVGFPIAVQILKKNLYYCNLRKNITIVASPPDPIVRWGWGSTISLTVSQMNKWFFKIYLKGKTRKPLLKKPSAFKNPKNPNPKLFKLFITLYSTIFPSGNFK